jgi:hypothetical protein
MGTLTEKPGPAWQPFTFGGVAAFAYASLSRLWLVQGIVALLSGCAVVWFFAVTCSPVVQEIIGQLPETASLQRGELVGIESPILAEQWFLSVLIDPVAAKERGQTSDLRIDFGARGGKVCSLFGCLYFWYLPMEARLARSALEPWWGAWQPMILAAAGVVSAGMLLLTWALLSLVYAVPVKVLAFFTDRDVSGGGSWKVAGAALMPGAIFMGLAIVLYGIHWLDLLRLLLCFCVHFVIGWVYVIGSPFFLGSLPSTMRLKKNPFANGKS